MAKKKESESAYVAIKEDIKGSILCDELKVGDRIMTESQICETYNVSRITAKRAVDELVREGYITRTPGKGSFVSHVRFEHLVTGLYRTNEEIRKCGMTPSSELIEFGEIQVSDVVKSDAIELRRKLFLYDYDYVYKVKRLRCADGEILALDTSYIPVKHCPSLRKEDIDNLGSIYDIMKKHFQIYPDRAQEYFSAKSVKPEDAVLLNVANYSPALIVTRVSYSKSNAVEYNYRIYKGEKYVFRINLEKFEP